MKTYSAKELQGFILELYERYMEMPWELGKDFNTAHICLNCNKVYKDKEDCTCKKRKKKKKTATKTKVKKAIGLNKPKIRKPEKWMPLRKAEKL